MYPKKIQCSNISQFPKLRDVFQNILASGNRQVMIRIDGFKPNITSPKNDRRVFYNLFFRNNLVLFTRYDQHLTVLQSFFLVLFFTQSILR